VTQGVGTSMRGATCRFMVMLMLTGTVGCHHAQAEQTLQITIRQKSIELAVRDTVTLHAVVTVSPSQEALTTVQWSSDNDAVADVDRRGVVTARAPGITDITARIGAAFATTRVTVSSGVSKRDTPALSVAVSNITLRQVEAAILFK
jgi:Bacterial Ig-like domain (group 2)